MSATNHTTNYNLPQYVSTDKPTYLVDFNTAMRDIDTAMHTNATNIETNSTNITGVTNSIGDLDTLTTTTKTSVVGAINEVNGETSSIGDLNNLETLDKTTIVSAINSANATNKYSETETVIGKWTNNDLIYRKVITFQVLNESSTDYVEVSTGLSNTYKIIKPLSICKANGYDMAWFARGQVNMYMTTVDNILTFKFLPAQNECVGTWTMIIEYTKNAI